MHEGRGFQAPALWPQAGLIARFYRKQEVTSLRRIKLVLAALAVAVASFMALSGGNGSRVRTH
jgi:hypothetical protein